MTTDILASAVCPDSPKSDASATPIDTSDFDLSAILYSPSLVYWSFTTLTGSQSIALADYGLFYLARKQYLPGVRHDTAL